MKSVKSLVLCMFSIIMIVSFSLPAFAASDDITGHYFESDMRALINKGILKGTAPNKYEPDKSVTRAEYAAFVVRTLELDKYNKADLSIAELNESNFKDVKLGDWYSDVVQIAAKAGIVGGYPDGTFKPKCCDY